MSRLLALARAALAEVQAPVERPIPPAHRPATTAEATELRALVHAVLADPADRQEALRAGLGDIESALTCYRALAAAGAP